MPFVAVLGAGEIGGATARALAIHARVDVIRLIDEQPGIAAGKALDLQQGGPIAGSDCRLEASTDFAAAAGAAAIVIADPASSSNVEWSGEAGLVLLRRLSKLGCTDQSVMIFAGAGHRTLMQQAIDELGLSRRLALGSAPEALAAIARALVALQARVSPSQVALTVIGRPPDRMIVPWTEASIGGHSVSALLDAAERHVLERRLAGLWPPGSGTLGTAAALFCEAAVAGSRRLFSAFVSLDRDNGMPAPVAAWPVSIGPAGLERVTTPSLTGRERVVMDGILE